MIGKVGEEKKKKCGLAELETVNRLLKEPPLETA